MSNSGNAAMQPACPDRNQTRPALRRIGLASWSILGILALAVVIAVALGAVSGILIPLVIAVIAGIVLEPLVELLKRVGLPPALAGAGAVFAAIAAVVCTIAIVVWGIVRQYNEIHRQLALGWDALLVWGRGLDIESSWLEHARTAVQSHLPQLGQGLAGIVTNTFYGVISLIVGTFFAVFFLYFTLRDGSRFPVWLARSTSLDPAEVAAVVSLTRESVRGYFKGTAVTALITAPIFMIPLLLLRIPLAIPIFILYFALSFIPFVGAWITGAFAVLIAFGAAGPTAALILTVTFVISNGSIQSAVSSWALGASLRLHPVAVLLATMIGGTVAGLIGMVLGPPLLAAVVKSTAAVRQYRAAPGSTRAPAVD